MQDDDAARERDLASACHHEAGHAVVCLAVGLCAVSVRADRKGGEVVWSSNATDTTTRRRLLVATVAGPLAESLFRLGVWEPGEVPGVLARLQAGEVPAGDALLALQLAAALSPAGCELERVLWLLGQVEDVARRQLRRRWAQVEALAEILQLQPGVAIAGDEVLGLLPW